MKKGFTLLEIMVAIALIAIVLVTVLKLTAQTVSMNEHAKFYAAAPLLLQEKIAEMDLAPNETQFSEAGDFGEAYPGYAWQVSAADVVSDTLGATAERLKRFDWTVSFNEGQFVYRSSVLRLLEEEP